MDASKIPTDAKYIICKYCKFFNPETNGCYLYTMYDQALDENSSKYTRFQDTEPNNWCSHFSLTYLDLFTKDQEPLRKDGTPKISFSDYPELKNQLASEEEIEETHSNQSQAGCYIATSVYGSYNCPQVWTLRRFRDNILAGSAGGRLFIHIYYSLSPTFVKLFGNTFLFTHLLRNILNKIVSYLQQKGIDSTPYNDKI